MSRHSIKVLYEAADLQIKKGSDYQSYGSSIKQSDHYRRGIDTIHDVIAGKVIRAQSLLESNSKPNFESLEDTYMDIINYASFAVSYLRGKMDGQNTELDIFNKPKRQK